MHRGIAHNRLAARRDIRGARFEGFPPADSITRILHTLSSRSAKAFVKPAGMCWAMTIGGVSAGMRVSKDSIACGPPVDAPMAMMPLRRRG